MLTDYLNLVSLSSDPLYLCNDFALKKKFSDKFSDKNLINF